jgi:hypothetical protein
MNVNSTKYLIATSTGKALVMTLNDQTSKFATFYVQKTNLNGQLYYTLQNVQTGLYITYVPTDTATLEALSTSSNNARFVFSEADKTGRHLYCIQSTNLNTPFLSASPSTGKFSLQQFCNAREQFYLYIIPTSYIAPDYQQTFFFFKMSSWFLSWTGELVTQYDRGESIFVILASQQYAGYYYIINVGNQACL